jgi:glycosyltransferase involved in cell wall biosynthesis
MNRESEPAAAGNETFSVVIPTYNRVGTVERAIRSARDQSLRPLEIIVVDDGSNDGTDALLRSLPGPVRVVRQDQAGVATARNRGAFEAHGKWLAFLDSDDYWRPDHLSRIAQAIGETSGRADLYFDDTSVSMSTYDGGGRSLRTGSLWEFANFQPEEPHAFVLDATPWVTLSIQPMMLQSSVISRESFLSLGGVAPELPLRQDTHLFLRLGIGRPACAVAGIGTQMTDDAGDERLTHQLPPSQLPYWVESAFMYDDILGSDVLLEDHVRRYLANEAATAHWRVARLSLRGLHAGTVVRSLYAVHRRRPSFVLRQGWARIRRGDSS